MTSMHCQIMRCQSSGQAVDPDLPHTLLKSRPTGILGCLQVSKGLSSRVRRCHCFRLRNTPWSVRHIDHRHRNTPNARAMDSSAPHRLSLIEGSQLQERPDSTNENFLYTHMLCPYAQTALLTLLHLDVPHQVVHIDLSTKPAWFTQLCRDEGFSATVPVIDCGGKAQTESIDICRWLCEHYQHAESPSLIPSNPQDRHQMDMLIQQRQGLKNAGMDLLAGTTASQWKIGTKQSKHQWKAFEEQLSQFQAAIKKGGGRFLMGHEVSLADLLYFPFMERFALAMPEFTGYDPCDACDEVMSQWLKAMMQQTSCQLASPDAKLFQQAIRQHRSLDFFDYSTYKAYQLHPHLQ